jgi:hypothetical protein
VRGGPFNSAKAGKATQAAGDADYLPPVEMGEKIAAPVAVQKVVRYPKWL